MKNVCDFSFFFRGCASSFWIGQLGDLYSAMYLCVSCARVHQVIFDPNFFISYLEESLLAIDPRNGVTSEHLPTVIGDMVQRLTEFITANPSHKEKKTLRKVLLQARALIK